MTVSGLLNGEYGISDVYMAMPCIVGRNGIRKILPIPLSEKELNQLNDSAKLLKNIIKESNLDI
ncbi:MAG: hypothetical protein KMY54_01170 [Erysipelothrix sp.]|nr:hypothetical protein [Erysipelothrix sp.]